MTDQRCRQFQSLQAACSKCLQQPATHGKNVKPSIRSWNLVPVCLYLLSSSFIHSQPPPTSDFYFSCHASFTVSLRIVPSLSFSQSFVQGHGIFPWVFTHKIIWCWRAGPAVELIASNTDNRDKGRGEGKWRLHLTSFR